MAHAYDPGPVAEPLVSLARDYPGEDVYSHESFRTEWGPIFHRGRLDGSARVLVLGQDPAASESIARRILVGEAGHRIQGFLAKLGLERSYVMVNTFVFSVFGQHSGEEHKNDPGIVAYRSRWLEALLAPGKIEAVITLGHLADEAWTDWSATPAGQGAPEHAHLTHPTQPDAVSHDDPVALATATKALLRNWNKGLDKLAPLVEHPDVDRPLEHYGDTWAPGDRVEIPEEDLPAGLPAWMRSPTPWATRVGATPAEKRRTIAVTAPE
jgi:uracil-DNA glycosylase